MSNRRTLPCQLPLSIYLTTASTLRGYDTLYHLSLIPTTLYYRKQHLGSGS